MHALTALPALDSLSIDCQQITDRGFEAIGMMPSLRVAMGFASVTDAVFDSVERRRIARGYKPFPTTREEYNASGGFDYP